MNSHRSLLAHSSGKILQKAPNVVALGKPPSDYPRTSFVLTGSPLVPSQLVRSVFFPLLTKPGCSFESVSLHAFGGQKP